MADIVLVHGIAQEQSGVDRLEREWVPDLASGIRATRRPGANEVADELLYSMAHPKTGLSVRMAFYGDLFLDPGVQGMNDDLSELDVDQVAFAEALACQWLRHAASRDGHLDRDNARLLLASLEPSPHDQGLRHRVGASAIRAAAQVRWLAYLGMGVAQSCVNRSLRQVTLYLTDPKVRVEALARIHELVGPETRAIIGHSLGSVVAYEYLQSHEGFKLPLFLTLGSPLALDWMIYRKLIAAGYPQNVRRWVNLADRDDIVAADPDLVRRFGADAGDRLESTWTVDNGAKPHEARFYLTKAQAGRPVLDVLESRA